MFPVFSSLKGLVKLKHITTDSVVFQLHYKATVLFLLASCIAISTRQFLGDPIHCTVPSEDISGSIIDSYCWIHSTFTLPGAIGSAIDSEVPFPGVDKYDKGDEIQYHAYYQWVCFVLIVQAAMFYVPKFLWKSFEGGRIVNLILDLDKPIGDKGKKEDNHNMLATYVTESFGSNNMYAMKYILCEVLNFINVIGQIYLVNYFLDGQFINYGPEVLAFSETDQEDRADPMIKVFPRVTKCTFRKFGPSGDIQRLDSMCVLPLNIINEKIYVFMWFWFVLLALFTTISLIYRLLTFVGPIRYQLLKSRVRKVNEDFLHEILLRTGVGDWFLLYLLGKNMSPINFKVLIDKIDKLVKDDHENKYGLKNTNH